MVLYTDRIRVVLPHLLLYVSTIIYGLLGAVIFHRIELPFETEHLKRHSVAIAEAQETLVISSTLSAGANARPTSNTTINGYFNDSMNIVIDALILVSMEAFSEGIRASDLTAIFGVLATMPPARSDRANYDEDSSETERLSQVIGSRIRPKWNFHSSLFFTTTLLTSIGYGNLVPISPYGRIFCICYAFLGIPLTLITIADLAKFFADLLVRLPVVARFLIKKLQWKGDDDCWQVNEIDSSQSSLRRHNRDNSLAQISVSGQRHISRGGCGSNVLATITRRITLSDVEYEESKRQQYANRQSNDGNDNNNNENRDEEDDDMMSEPGFWTKNFVLALLFLYMTVMALIFSMIQTNWNFLDAFYFCLITLVTIGFGDFCPIEESHYGGWIAFIFVGLILSTLTVDLVGSATIERIHTLGRGLDLCSLLTMLVKSRPDSARILQQLYAGAYKPNDLRLIPYIDQITNGTNGNGSLLNFRANFGLKMNRKNNSYKTAKTKKMISNGRKFSTSGRRRMDITRNLSNFAEG